MCPVSFHGIVYVVTCDQNGKRYVGKTTHGLHGRWRHHVFAARKGKDPNPLYEDMRKYGEEAFHAHVLDTCTDSKTLAQRECHFIQELNTTDLQKGYNKLPMANRRVSIWKYAKIDGKWKYVKPVFGKNGKIKPGWVLINGEQKHCPDGAYYLRFYEGKKSIWTKCSSAAQATLDQARQETYLNARAMGIIVQNKVDVPPMISDLLEPWLEEYRLSHHKDSHAGMKETLYEFFGHYDEQGKKVRGFCDRNIISQVSRVDLLRYRQWLVGRKRSPRTAANKMLRVNQFIRSVLGLAEGKGPVTVKDAKFTELEPTVYTEDELVEFFKHCDPWRTAIFKTYLMAGLRKAELENLTWEDVDLKSGIVRVASKPHWQPKTWEERTIEIPDELVTILTALTHRGKTVFANSAGNMYTHSWDDCKEIGEKAKIADCHPHKFRSTFATRTLQHADLKTVQKLLGHKDIESTMRYLARAESKKTREKVNAVWA